MSEQRERGRDGESCVAIFLCGQSDVHPGQSIVPANYIPQHVATADYRPPRKREVLFAFRV